MLLKLRSRLRTLQIICLLLALLTNLTYGQRLSSRGRAQVQFNDMTNAQLSQYLANLTPRLMLNAFLTLEDAQRAEAINRTQSLALGVVVNRIEDRGISDVFQRLARDSTFNLYATVQDHQALMRLGFANVSAWRAYLEANVDDFVSAGDSAILSDGLLNLLRDGTLAQRYLQARGADRYDDLALALDSEELRRFFFLVDEDALSRLIGVVQHETLATLAERADVETLAVALSSAPPASTQRLVNASLKGSAGRPSQSVTSQAKFQQAIARMRHGGRAAELLRRVPALQEGLDVTVLAQTMRPSVAAAFLLSAPTGLDTAPFFADPNAERRIYDFVNALEPLERALMFLDIDSIALNDLLGQATIEERTLWLDEAPVPVIATLLNRAEPDLRRELIDLLPPDILTEVLEGTDDADLLDDLRGDPALDELDIPWDELLAFFDDPWSDLLDDPDALADFFDQADEDGRAALLQVFGLRALLDVLPTESFNALLAEADPELLEEELANLNDYQALRLLAQADPTALEALGLDEAAREGFVDEVSLALIAQGTGSELARALLDLPIEAQTRALAEVGYDSFGALLEDLTPGQAQAFVLSLDSSQAWGRLSEQASDQIFALLSSAPPLVIAASLEAMSSDLRFQVAAVLPPEALADAIAWFSNADEAREALEANPQAAALLLTDEQDDSADASDEAVDDSGDDGGGDDDGGGSDDGGE
ncbi:MAG: hypothetical protein NZ750_12195 [Anaerolineae bacterium]|nr:hypothetical protein [Anaerolineae bacterium]MDW8172124.1 hypothetical protein [Anaerolineae bacterium]